MVRACQCYGARRAAPLCHAVPMRSLSCLALLLGACAGESPVADPSVLGASVQMNFGGEFFDAPFPSEHLRGDGDGEGARLTGFPNDQSSPYLSNMLRMAEARDGFGTASGVFFTATAELDPASLPSLEGSVREDASVFITPLEGDDAGRARVPVNVTFHVEAPPGGAPRMLTVLPVAGISLDPARTYAAVVTRRVRTAAGAPLAMDRTWRGIVDGVRPAALSAHDFAAYRDAAAVLGRAGVSPTTVSGIAVFRTGDARREFARAVEVVRGRTTLTPSGFTRAEVFPDFCVYAGEVMVPVFQRGTAPYTSQGEWAFEADGGLALQGMERSRVVLTIPRRAMPAGGYPVTVFIRTGAGGDRPLVDRGVRGANGMPLEAGTGLGRDFAREGVAGISWDGPHGGPRNVSRGDEQFLVYNFGNLRAMRDNVRQSALETVLLADAVERVQVDLRDCEGATAPNNTGRFDAGRVALFGHSMGAAIAPLAVAQQPRFTAVMLSGAGGSWIGNVMFKERPLPVRAAAEMLLRFPAGTLRVDNPALAILEWAMEAADVAPYGRYVSRSAPRNILMMQGIVDHYIPPPVAQATSLSFGLDLAGPARDASLTQFASLASLLPLNGRAQVDGSISNNRGGVTMVVRQYLGDDVEDGHEAVFQTDPPRRDLACFLRSWLRGAASVPADGAGSCP